MNGAKWQPSHSGERFAFVYLTVFQCRIFNVNPQTHSRMLTKKMDPSLYACFCYCHVPNLVFYTNTNEDKDQEFA